MKSILPCLIALAISAFGQGFNVPKDSDISITWVTNSVFTYTPTSHIDLYGTGEVAGPLRRNGDKNLYWNIDNWGYRKYGGKMMYASMPWVMGLKEDGSCVGFIFDTAACSELNCGEDGSIKFTCNTEPYRVISISKSTPEDLLASLAEITGRMDLPPLWVLGYHQCRYSYHPDRRVREVAMKFREKGIPCDSMWLDIHYMNEYRLFTFNEKEFPDPLDLSTFLHTNDFKLVTIIDAGIKVDANYFAYNELVDLGCYMRRVDQSPYVGRVWPGDCIFPDFLDERARSYWADLNANFVKANGIDGIWNDMDEPSIFNGVNTTMSPDALHCDGSKHALHHNAYSMNLIRATKEGLLKGHPNKRPFILTRSNFLGGQKYAAMWTGDNYAGREHLLLSIPMSLNISLSGQPFNGPDMGGFSGHTNGELLADWMSIGAYFPFMRNHSDNNTKEQEPWAFGEECERRCKTSIERRYKLLPYLYTLFHAASTKGLPPMLPAFMLDPKNPEYRNEERVFMLGKDVLVIPPWVKDDFVVPQGWKAIDFGDDKEGQATLYLRPGAAIPMCNKPMQSTADYDATEIVVIANLDGTGKASGLLYVDAGEGFEYKSGKFLLSFIQVTEGKPLQVQRIQGSFNKPCNFKQILL